VSVAAGRLLVPTGAWASGAVFQFDAPFPADPSPAGSAPWVEAFFQDVSPGTVQLTITNVGLTTGEFVAGDGNGANGGFFFNLNPVFDPDSLVFDLVSSNGNFSPVIKAGIDGFKADGDGKYDIRFDFSQGTFTVNSSITYLISGIPGLLASDFAYLSAPAGGSGPFYAAAHVQGLPSSGGATSTWLSASLYLDTSVPEPSPVALCSLLAGFWMAKRPFRKRTRQR
jgi:hypothetical protein